jgi:inner membrane protein
MDSVTQVVLGSAVGQATLGSKIGRKAIVWGAICGTLPDLDVFIPFGGAVENFTFHRSFSHAFIVHLLITPLLVWLILKIHPTTRPYRTHWFWLVLLALTTHAILDCFTVYGTQIFWPISEYPVAISSVFIIDPLYTLPLLVGVVIAWRSGQNPRSGPIFNSLGLLLSSVYLGWTLFAKWEVNTIVAQTLAERHIQATAMESTPAPLNSLLWRVVVMAGDHYYEGYRSVLDNPPTVNLDAYPTQPELLNDIASEWGVRRLQWFIKGLYSVRTKGNAVVMSDLRMGVEGSYVFTFEVGRLTPEGVKPGNFKQLTSRLDLGHIGMIWDRIWDPSISLTPTARMQMRDTEPNRCFEAC